MGCPCAICSVMHGACQLCSFALVKACETHYESRHRLLVDCTAPTVLRHHYQSQPTDHAASHCNAEDVPQSTSTLRPCIGVVGMTLGRASSAPSCLHSRNLNRCTAQTCCCASAPLLHGIPHLSPPTLVQRHEHAEQGCCRTAPSPAMQARRAPPGARRIAPSNCAAPGRTARTARQAGEAFHHEDITAAA